MAEYEKNPDEIGVLYKNTSKAGNVYFSGTIAGQKVVGFPRKGKEGKKDVITIIKSKPKEEQDSIPF